MLTQFGSLTLNRELLLNLNDLNNFKIPNMFMNQDKKSSSRCNYKK